MYAKLPGCLEELEYALQNSTVETRTHAQDVCIPLAIGDRHGIVLEDIRKTVSQMLLLTVRSIANGIASVSQKTQTILIKPATRSLSSG